MLNKMDIQTSVSEKKENKPGVYIKTFGCQMNEYDTEKMLSLLSSSHQQVENPEAAEVIIVNTCSVREKAAHKLNSLLGKLRELKHAKPELVLGVSGCLAQQEGNKLIKRNPLIDFVVGTHNLSLVPALVQAAQRGSKAQVAVDYREEWENLPIDFEGAELIADVAHSQVPGQSNTSAFGVYSSPVRALVAIQRGCDKKCSFCVVPTTRGPEVSRDPEEVIREVRLKVRLGAREVLLLGQTVNSYGRDLNPRYRFETLIRRLAEIENLQRIRFTSPHPAEVRKEFLELFVDVPQLCPYIHLPLQSGSNRILKLMNRNYKRERYLDIVDSLRQQCPEIAISTDIIVGFPTETEGDFEETLDLVSQVRYNASYLFKYSRRPNTTAAQYSIDEEVSANVASQRLLRLQSLQEKISEEINATFLGKELEVLVEAKSKNILTLMRGRIPQNTLVEVSGSSPKIGEIVKVRIEHTGAYGLRGLDLQQ